MQNSLRDGTFPISSSVDIIFVGTWKFLPFCYSATDLVFFLLIHLLSVVLFQFIVALVQSCLSSYHSSFIGNLHQLSCSASCLHLASLLRICTLLRFSHFTSKAN